MPISELTRVDRAISVRQPWAFAIAAGFKTTENRGTWCNYRGPVALHSSLQRADYVGWPQREAAVAYQNVGAGANLWQAERPPLPSVFSAPPDPRLALGGVVAVGEIVGCHHAEGACCPQWGQQEYRSRPDAEPKRAVHIELAHFRPLPRAIHVRGRLGVPWRLTEEATAAVAAALAEMTTRPYAGGES